MRRVAFLTGLAFMGAFAKAFPTTQEYGVAAILAVIAVAGAVLSIALGRQA